VRVLIVDDEPPARQRIRGLLAETDGVEVVGECGDGFQAIEAVRTLRPDLLFLDVQMPELDGFEVLAALDGEALPTVIFVTAYDQYALKAFEARALDYLLKPYDAERFHAVLRRAREHVERGRGLDARIAELLAELRARERRWLTRIPVEVRERVHLVPTDRIDYLEAEGSYVRLHVKGGSHLIRETLTSLEGRLDPARFVRVHRSRIVNVDRVHMIEPSFKGAYVLVLENGARLVTGRTFRDRVRRAFDLGR